MRLDSTVQMGDIECKTKKLEKIDMDYLTENMPKELLNEIEEERLGGQQKEKEFLPDKKAPIYNFFAKNKKIYEFSEQKKKHEIFNIYHSFEFCDEEATNLNFIFRVFRRETGLSGEVEIRDGATGNQIKRELYLDEVIELMKIKSYAELIDKTRGGNLSQQLYNEIGVFFEKLIIAENEDKNINPYALLVRLPIYSNLKRSYSALQEYVNRTESDFRAAEEKRRNIFYVNNDGYDFKEQLRVRAAIRNKMQADGDRQKMKERMSKIRVTIPKEH